MRCTLYVNFSNEILISSTTTKSEDGQIMAAERTVRGPIASISCEKYGKP